jgi:hypothetical protein
MKNELYIAGLFRQLREVFSALSLRTRSDELLALPHFIRVDTDETYRRDFNRLWSEMKSNGVRGSFDQQFETMREKFKRLNSPGPVIDIGRARLRLTQRRSSLKEPYPPS